MAGDLPSDGHAAGDTPEDLGDHMRGAYQAWLGAFADGLAAGLPNPARGLEDDVVTVGVRAFTPEDLPVVLNTQFGFYQETFPLILKPELQLRGVVACAWRSVVYRQTRAVVELVGVSLDNEMHANARAALEHAVMLQALADAERSGQGQAFIEAVNDTAQDHAASLFTVLEKADAAGDGRAAHLIDAVRGLVTKADMPRRDRHWDGVVQQLFSGLDDGAHLYALYKALSTSTHAGLGSAMPYLQRLLTEGQFASRPVLQPRADILGMLSWACLSADKAVDEYLEEPKLAAGQRAALEPFGLAP